MSCLRIKGGNPLHGIFSVAGAKNAALPLMCASLLTEEPLLLQHLPDLADIRTLSLLLKQLGVRIENGKICAKNIESVIAPYHLVNQMRASILVLGPLLARLHEARVSLPGGCAIGARPVDLHLKGLEKLGAHIELDDGYIVAKAPYGLKGAEIVLPFPSVGATENLLMAATLAKGKTHLIGVAHEPEIIDLIACLKKMGSVIYEEETGTITIEGKELLSGATHHVISDRIEAGSLIIAAAATGGSLFVEGANASHLHALIALLSEAGVMLEERQNGICVSACSIRGISVSTQPYPGFPTDLQAQMMALLTCANGVSIIRETIFENRFMHVPELIRMGANIYLDGNAAIVTGISHLTGTHVRATDLRASMSLVIAGLIASGETVISDIYHLDRGYEYLDDKLRKCGADVQRIL